ncbi:MAG: LPS assembly lipoprotein LptE [Campylobacterota bacterium]|nr:LPS assembly lipoprotein LptE [Campylobacterota bacterium]
MKLYTLYFLIFSLFVGCGYKPATYYAKNEIVGKVFVESPIDIENSENSIIIKDAMNEMVINQFNGILTDEKNSADTIVIVDLTTVSHTALSTDNEGYTKSYRTTVKINVKYRKVDSSSHYKSIDVSNYYDYSVDDDLVITDQKKIEAVKQASVNALSDIFSKIAINTFKK